MDVMVSIYTREIPVFTRLHEGEDYFFIPDEIYFSQLKELPQTKNVAALTLFCEYEVHL